MNIKRGLPIGGQALPNGVMMRSREKYTVALRLRSGRIVTGSWRVEQKRVFRKPVLRGIYQLFASFRASFQTIFRAVQLSKRAGELRIAPLSVISATAAVLMLTLSVFVSDWIYGYLGESLFRFSEPYLFTLIYGIADLILLCAALLLITRLPAVKRLLQYHGAEHKAIACYEKGLDMTMENVRAQSRFHKRCGTSMMVFVVLAVFVAAELIPPQLPETAQELILCAVVLITAGWAYEAMRARKMTMISRIGLMAQRITTREPDDHMIECAIAAVIEAVKSESS